MGATATSLTRKKPRAKPVRRVIVPATKRTLSLFTGRTDVEDVNARDGSTGAQLNKQRPKRPVPWETDGGQVAWVRTWRRGPKKGQEMDRIERLGEGRYEARRKGTFIGIFASLAEATTAVERAS